jgi:multiple sugar transport system permease protein
MRVSRVLLYVVLSAVGVAFALPIIWMAATSIKPESQVLSDSVGLLPQVAGEDGPLSKLNPAYWTGVAEGAKANYNEVLETPIADFRLYLRNSLLVAFLSVIGMVLSSSIVAYGFSRVQWRGRDATFVLVLATMMIPFTVIMAPQYLLFKHLGWIGSFKPLWVPAWFGGAFSIFLLRQFFMGIPRELDEAARIDGCSHIGIFRHVIVPLSRPAIAAVALFQFIASWNDFAGPLIFINHEDMYTLPIGLQMYQSQHGGTPWNLVMAASTLVVIPVLVLFLLAQRSFVEGVATQGLKE